MALVAGDHDQVLELMPGSTALELIDYSPLPDTWVFLGSGDRVECLCLLPEAHQFVFDFLNVVLPSSPMLQFLNQLV